MAVRQIPSRQFSRGRRSRVQRARADRQVSPTVLSSSLFRHARSLCGKYGGVNFRPCSRRRFTLTRHVASARQAALTSFRRGQQRAAFSVPPAGSRRKSARGLAQSKTLREVRRPLENAPASWTAVALHRFRFKVQQIACLRTGFEDENEDDPASVL
jgi:hypothetical protein